MLKDALSFWNAIEGKVRETVKAMSGGNLQCERYDVSTAPNGGTGLIGVKQPYGNEIFIPYADAVSNAAVGDTVLVFWWKSMSNAKAWYLTDRIGESGGTPPSPSSSIPLTDGTGTAGTSTDYARGDHVHPSDNNKSNLLTTETKTSAKQTISGGSWSSPYISIDISKTGYTPIAVAWLRTDLGTDGQNYTLMSFSRWEISGNTLYIAARNNGSSQAIFYVKANILYVKN